MARALRHLSDKHVFLSPAVVAEIGVQERISQGTLDAPPAHFYMALTNGNIVGPFRGTIEEAVRYWEACSQDLDIRTPFRVPGPFEEDV